MSAYQPSLSPDVGIAVTEEHEVRIMMNPDSPDFAEKHKGEALDRIKRDAKVNGIPDDLEALSLYYKGRYAEELQVIFGPPPSTRRRRRLPDSLRARFPSSPRPLPPVRRNFRKGSNASRRMASVHSTTTAS